MDSNNEPVPNLELAMKRSMLAKNKLAMIVKKTNGVVQYSCVECSAYYYTKEELERHLLVHNKDYRYLCGICGTGLKRKEHLDRHTMEHKEVRPHVCPECGKAFKRKEHLNIHRSIHSGDKSQSCPVCDKTFYRKDHLRKHLQIHTKVFIENVEVVDDQGYMDTGNNHIVDIKQEIIDEYSRPVVSEELDEEMEAPEEKYNISEKTNGSADKPYVCLVCSKTFNNKEYLKIHSWTHMKKEHICTLCGTAFHLEDQLLNHMNEHLQPYTLYSGDEDYAHLEPMQSPLQNEYSTDNSLLIARSERQHKERLPHECDICHRRFKRKQHLKVHRHVHNKEPKVWCSDCGEGFPTNAQCEAHQCTSTSQLVITQLEEPPQGAPLFEEFPPLGSSGEGSPQVITQEAKKENKYPQEFVDVSELAVLDSVQYVDVEERELPTPQRVFVCKYCSKPFKRKDHYKIHLHIHTGVKSFFCTECGKGFYRKDHLQKHMLVHNKPKPKKEIPDLYPINKMPLPSKAPLPSKVPKKQVLPEITIHAPSNTKLRVPLQIKVPYQMVMSMENGEQRAFTIDPQASPVAT